LDEKGLVPAQARMATSNEFVPIPKPTPRTEDVVKVVYRKEVVFVVDAVVTVVYEVVPATVEVVVWVG
jgi:type II secretory pathway component HofQ